MVHIPLPYCGYSKTCYIASILPFMSSLRRVAIMAATLFASLGWASSDYLVHVTYLAYYRAKRAHKHRDATNCDFWYAPSTGPGTNA